MEHAIKLPARVYRVISNNIRLYSNGLGELGSGAGRGGGGGGSIRAAGGAFGKLEAAHEEEYFHREQRKKLAMLKEGLSHEVTFHKLQIKEHERALARHKKRIDEIDTHNL